MENKTNWWLIIGIVVVVAVITALVTMQVTGNVVSVTNTDRTSCINSCYTEKCTSLSTATLTNRCKSNCSVSCSKVDVYTKAEIDALLANMGSGDSYTKEEIDSLFASTFNKNKTVVFNNGNSSGHYYTVRVVPRSLPGTNLSRYVEIQAYKFGGQLDGKLFLHFGEDPVWEGDNGYPSSRGALHGINFQLYSVNYTTGEARIRLENGNSFYFGPTSYLFKNTDFLTSEFRIVENANYN